MAAVVAAHIGAADMGHNDAADSDKSWWQLLEPCAAGGSNLASATEQALQAVARDAQWCSSGVPELLKRAHALAASGAAAAAKVAVLSILDFRSTSERIALARMGRCWLMTLCALQRGGGGLGRVHTCRKACSMPAANCASTGTLQSRRTRRMFSVTKC
jgi:hypothetical protein